MLSGKFARDGAPTSTATADASSRASFDFPPVDKPRAHDCVDEMRPMAAARGVSVAQIALAWVLHQPAVTSVILGAKRPEQLAGNLAAAAVQLTADELAALDAVSRLPAEYPAWMLSRQGEQRRRQIAEAQRPPPAG